VSNEILDVDLIAFERGTAEQRRAVVDGVRRSLATGFVYTSHDLSEDLLDTAYGMLREFFSLDADTKSQFVAPGAHGQTGYTGLLVETAASSDLPDWKEMLNWSAPIPAGHPLRRGYPTAYPEQVLPESAVPGITEVLYAFHHAIDDLQRRFLRIIAVGIGCHESFFDEMTTDAPSLTRAIRYPSMHDVPADGHVWAGSHGDINLITALPRATAPGLQVQVDGGWVDAAPPDGRVIINTGIMLERLTNGVIPIGWHRVVAAPGFEGERYSVVQFCHPRPWTVLQPVPSCITADNPQRFSAITAADALDEVIFQINLVEDARRVADAPDQHETVSGPAN
jgi:isopenicillin N synthase-like dioxygenase